MSGILYWVHIHSVGTSNWVCFVCLGFRFVGFQFVQAYLQVGVIVGASVIVCVDMERESRKEE